MSDKNHTKLTNMAMLKSELAFLQTSIPDYFAANPSVDALILGAVVFCGEHMLIIQRAKDDFAGSMWEIPGGTCEQQKDSTLWHALARELREETGLSLRDVNSYIDQVDFDDSNKPGFTWRKITFEVDVEEGAGLSKTQQKELVSAHIKLEPSEHQNWSWVTREEVQNEEFEGGRLQFLEEQKKTLLRAFDNRAT